MESFSHLSGLNLQAVGTKPEPTHIQWKFLMTPSRIKFIQIRLWQYSSHLENASKSTIAFLVFGL
eukprot:1154286-Pelagomonas_calceolata.AAC.3